MKAYFDLMCDFGHRWGGFFDENFEVSDVCPQGHDAVTCTKRAPIDQVQITFRPAGRLTDTVKEQYSFENKVQIVIGDIHQTWAYESKKLYSWREAEGILRMFEKKSIAQAKQIIESKGDI
jgi:hypothetical protein